MPVSKELQDVIELIAQYDEKYQREAVEAVLRVVNQAEQDIADSHMTKEERRAVRRERLAQLDVQRKQRLIETQDKLIGKAAAKELRAKYAELEKRQQEARRDLGLG